MKNKKNWEEFQKSGLLWWTNMILHTFGWAICYKVDENGDIINVYPDRVHWRGFSEENNTEGYIKISQYMKDNCSELLKEAKEK